jgi:hypothetical protein
LKKNPLESVKVKLHFLFLILSSIIIPFVGVGQQGIGAASHVMLPANSAVNAPVAGLALVNGQDSFQSLPDGGRYQNPQDTTRQKSRAKAKEAAPAKPEFKKPKVSGKTSKRKARRAKTSG